ncbi:hypothetical protein NIES2101_43170 [Calothrix sp. HK-06]|nr:hypothetical protein NIES2101_43170 [Calothrix sp. HK-06]
MSKKKQPKIKVTPSPTRQAKIVSSPDSYNKMNPSWRVSKIEMVDPYGWHNLDARTLLYIKDKLANFESMTWSEILVEGKKFNHSVNVQDLCTEAQTRLRETKQDDLDQLVSLRLTGKQRVWGILDQGVMTLLWWDPEHDVCPSQLRNT